VTTGETPVKSWWINGDSCETGPANGPAADALVLREARGLKAEGKSGDA
jgi:hypothetical protein